MTTITISKSEILNEVEKRSSLEGLVQPGKFDLLWASTETVELLESYWIEGYTAVVQLLKRYIKSDTITYKLTTVDQSEILEIGVEMPARYSSLLDGSVTNDIKMLLACNILTGWLNVISPELSAKYDEEAKGYAEDLRVKLLYRIVPTNVTSTAKSDAAEFSEGVAIGQARSDSEGFVEGAAIGAAKSDSEEFTEGAAIGAAKSDTEGFTEETALSKAKSDSAEFMEGADLSAAKADSEGFAEEADISSAKTDSEGFVKEDFSTSAKTDTAEFVEEAALPTAKTDTEKLDQRRRCCNIPINPNTGQY